LAPVDTGAATTQPHEVAGASMLQEMAAAAAATSKGPSAAVAKLRAPAASLRREGLRAVVAAVGAGMAALPADQQSAWASQATPVVEALVRLVADGLGGPTHASDTVPAKRKAGSAERRKEREGAGGGEAEGAVREEHEEGCCALLPGVATACGALLKAHPSAPPRFAAGLLACMRRTGNAEHVALYQLLVSQLGDVDVRAAVVTTGGADVILELYARFTAELHARLPPRLPWPPPGVPQPPRAGAEMMSFVLHGGELLQAPPHYTPAPTPDLSRDASKALFSYHAERKGAQHFTPPEHVVTPENSFKLGRGVAGRGGSGGGLSSTPEKTQAIPLLTLGKNLLSGVQNAISPRAAGDHASSRPGSSRLREMRESMQEKYKPREGASDSDDSDVSSDDVETPRQLSLEESIRLDAHAEFDLPTPSVLRTPPAPRTPLVPKLMLPMETSASKLGGLTRSTRRSSAPGTERSLRSVGGSQRSLAPERSTLGPERSARAISEVASASPLFARTTGGLGSARAEMGQLAKELGETHLLADLTSLLAHRRYGPMRKAAADAAGGKGGRTTPGGKQPQRAPPVSGAGGGGGLGRAGSGTIKAAARAVGMLEAEQLAMVEAEQLAMVEACAPYRIKCLLLQALLALCGTTTGTGTAAAAARSPVNLLAAELAAEATQHGAVLSPVAVRSSRLRSLVLQVLQAYTQLPGVGDATRPWYGDAKGCES
jgi:hypothetical protein